MNDSDELDHERALVFAFCALGLLLRILAALTFPVVPEHDAATYDALARALAIGHGYTMTGRPETMIAPGYPFLISLVYRTTGPSVLAVTLLQGALDLIACVLLWRVVRRWAGPRTALVSLFFSLIAESAIAVSRVLHSEMPAAWLVTIAIVLLDCTLRNDRRWLYVFGAGLVLGALTLVRWNFSLFPMLVVAWLFFAHGWSRGLRYAALLSLGYALVVGPWIMRNERLIGVPLLSTQTGTTLYSSHFRQPGQPYGNNTHDATTDRADAMPPVEGNAYLVHETLRRLAAQPSLFLRPIPIKLVYFFVPIDWETIAYHSVNYTYFAYAMLALFGIVRVFSRERKVVVLYMLPMTYLAALSIPFYGSPRFRLPAEPLLCPFAAIAVVDLVDRVRRQRLAKATP